MSSSVYQALRAAGYPDSGIIEFATSLLAELCGDKGAAVEKEPPLDARTGFPTGQALVEIIEFELDRARATPHPHLGVIVVTLHTRELCSATEQFADENLIVDALQSRVRASDTAGRTDEREFVLLLPGAGSRAVASAARDIQRSLQGVPFSRGSVAEVRHTSLARTTPDALALLDAARRATPIEDVAAAQSRTTSDLLRRPVVLALCGGAAMAAAHIGVISALEDLGAQISGIGATSAGALVAAMHASGMGREAMLEKFVSLRSSPVYAQIRSAYAASRVRGREDRRGLSRARLGFASSQEVALTDDTVLRALVEHFVPCDRPIESMRIRLAFCATDLAAGRTTYISHGSLLDALMAACAVPGLFPPVKLGSMLLVDGSLTGELPVAAATSIAGNAGVIGSYLDGPDAAPSAYDSGIAVAARAAAIRERELVCEQTRTCEAVLRIPVKDVGWMGFGRCGDAERVGRETVLRDLASAYARDRAGAEPGRLI
jgi:predicted acylesterase/phospholipase RssA/GGDEF domain-containing protein